MRSYGVPPDINEKEKVVGGFLNINQLFWAIGGLGVGAVMFLIAYPFIGKLSLFVGAIFSLSGVPFALIKIHDLTMFEYLKRKRQFNRKNQLLPHRKNKGE